MERLRRTGRLGQERLLQACNAALIEWADASVLCARAFDGVDHYTDRLVDALGSKDNAERARESVLLLEDLWKVRPYLGPFEMLRLVAQLEADRAFHPKYRDHSSHVLKVFLLGLWAFDLIPVVRHSVLEEIGQEDADANGDFLLRWLVTAAFHDVGYILENDGADREGHEWKRTCERLNRSIAFPLSALPEFARSLSETTEREVVRRHEIYRPEFLSPTDFEHHATQDLLELLEDEAVRAGLGQPGENPLRAYYEFCQRNYAVNESRSGYRDHGIGSALILLTVFGSYSDYLSRVASLGDEAMMDSIKPRLISLDRETLNQTAAINHAASAIALHNVRRVVNKPAEAAQRGLTLERLTFGFGANGSVGAKSPLACLLRLCDALQAWERPRFDDPMAQTSALDDASYGLRLEDGRIWIRFEEDAKRFRNPANNADSQYSRLAEEILEFMDPGEAAALLGWDEGRPADTAVGETARAVVSEPTAADAPTDADPSLDLDQEAECIPDDESDPSRAFVLVASKKWLLGAVNFDEDMHFSSYYLRQSITSNLPDEYAAYGYESLVAINSDFNESYYIPEDECRKAADGLLRELKENPVWFQDLLVQIEARAAELKEVFPFTDGARDVFRSLSDDELLACYMQHDDAHRALYQIARVPEALDRGVNAFTDDLRTHLRHRDARLAFSAVELNKVFEALTFPESSSIAGMQMRELYDLLARIRSDADSLEAFSGNTRRFFLRADPSLVDGLQRYRSRWAYWGYHGYGNRALKDIDYFFGRVQAELKRSGQEHDPGLHLADALKEAERRRRQLFSELQIDGTYQFLFRLYARIGTTKLFRRYVQLRNFYFLDQLLMEIALRMGVREDILRCLLPEEVMSLLLGRGVPASANERVDSMALVLDGSSESILVGEQSQRLQEMLEADVPKAADGDVLEGQAVYLGQARGTARVVIRRGDPSAHEFREGDILVSESTDADLIDLIEMAGAVVTQSGGVSCHASTLCRELKVPAVVGVEGLLERVTTGDSLVVDAFAGTVRVNRPSTAATRVLSPEKVAVADPGDVGVKAQTLGRMGMAGMRVPKFFVVKLEDLSAAFPAGGMEGLGQDSQGLIQEVQDALEDLPGELFALRSSTLLEDLPGSSGAGMQLTELHVSREDVLQQLIAVSASILSPANERQPSGSVIVQQMILGDVSGVLLTMDPVHGDDSKLIVDATPGGNELLTSGAVVPVKYEIDRQTRVLEAMDGANGLLDRRMVDFLIDSGETLESLLGPAQSVEWTFVSGELWLLQSRPITGKPGTESETPVLRGVRPAPARDAAGLYRTYRVPPRLQAHMLQSAAVVRWILDRWRGPVLDEGPMLDAMLVHDIGNLVKANYDHNLSLLPDNGNVEYWKSIQSWLRARYGETDHSATEAIAREIGLSDRALEILNQKQFLRNEETLNSPDYAIKICAYADQRVSPGGVLPIQERLFEAIRRYRGVVGASVNDPKRDRLIECALSIEEQVFVHVDGRPQDVYDDSVNVYVDSLRKYRVADEEDARAAG